MSTTDELQSGFDAARDAEQPAEPETTGLPPTFREALAEFVMLHSRRRDVEAELETISQAIGKLEPMLLENFADTGIQNARVNGLLVYVRTDRFVSKRKEVSSDVICETLQAVGYGYLVTDSYNAASLKSLIKEIQEKGETVPEPLAEKINIGEVCRLATRK